MLAPRPGTTVALSVLMLSAVLCTTVHAQQPKVLAPHVPVAPPLEKRQPWSQPMVRQSATGGLWMTDANWKASLYLKNGVKTDPITVTPVLYLSNGQRYPLSPVTLEPSGTAILDIGQGLASQGIAPYATLYGYAEIEYQWPWAGVSATVRNVDTVNSLIYLFGLQSPPDSHPVHVASMPVMLPNSFEGLWWKQEKDVSGFVALANVTGQAVNATLRLTDSADGQLASYKITVSPHGTKMIPLNELKTAPSEQGGIYLTHDGPDHGLAVNAGLQDQAVGYSAHLWMLPSPEPSSKNPSQPPAKISFSQLGLMTGAADPMMNFPSGTVFTPYSLVRNMSDQPALITPELWWMAGGAPQSATLPQMTIAPHRTVNLNAAALFVAAGLKNFNGSVNLILDTQAQPGGLLMSSGSVDQKNTYVFEVMTHAIAEGASRQVCYWSTANGDDTMVTLWNPADEPQDFAFTLFYSGGQYVYPIHLGPRETHVFNVSEILHSSIPDVAGNVIPAGVTEGSAEIAGSQGEHQHILVGIEAGVYNVRKAICGSPCQVCNGVTSTDTLPSPFTVAVRGAAQETFYENWNTGGQSNVNATSTWSTSPSSIATVSAGLVSGVSAGSFGVSAEDNYSEPVYQAQFCAPNQQCPTVYWGSSANGTVLSLALSPTVLNMSSGDTGVTISLTISPGSASVQPAFTNSLSQNPNSSTQATLAITNPSGNVSGSYNAPVTVSNNGSNSPSGQFSVTASVNRVTSNTVDLAVPPQVLIQMIQAEAGGTNVTTMTAVAEVARNRFSSTIFGGHYTTYQNTIIPGQFATSSTTTGVEPELDIAASVFTGASAGNFCGSLSFWTPTSSQWQTVQAALQSGTTAFPANTGAPTYQAWSTSQQQIIFVPAVATQSNGAPSFLFLTQRSSSQAAAVSTSCN